MEVEKRQVVGRRVLESEVWAGRVRTVRLGVRVGGKRRCRLPCWARCFPSRGRDECWRGPGQAKHRRAGMVAQTRPSLDTVPNGLGLILDQKHVGPSGRPI
jgi:hypothetical protein